MSNYHDYNPRFTRSSLDPNQRLYPEEEDEIWWDTKETPPQQRDNIELYRQQEAEFVLSNKKRAWSKHISDDGWTKYYDNDTLQQFYKQNRLPILSLQQAEYDFRRNPNDYSLDRIIRLVSALSQSLAAIDRHRLLLAQQAEIERQNQIRQQILEQAELEIQRRQRLAPLYEQARKKARNEY